MNTAALCILYLLDVAALTLALPVAVAPFLLLNLLLLRGKTRMKSNGLLQELMQPVKSLQSLFCTVLLHLLGEQKHCVHTQQAGKVQRG